MTDKEKAEDYEMDCIADVYKGDVCTIPYAYSAQKLEQTYLEGHSKGFDAGYKKATERAYERQQDLTDTYIKDGEKIKQLEKENEELKAQNKDLCESLDIMNNRESELLDQIKEMQEQIEKNEVRRKEEEL